MRSSLGSWHNLVKISLIDILKGCFRSNLTFSEIMISIKNLSVSIDDKAILSGLTIDASPGSVHAIMGPNGSGKSTLAQSIIGNPNYKVSAGSITFNDREITDLSPHERARLGIFLSFQQPPAIPGLRVFNLLKEMRQAQTDKPVDLHAFEKEVKDDLEFLKMDQSFMHRSCNDGFSGGEKKRFELLQILIAQPKLLILDEIDSGLDIDALKLVALVIQKLKKANPDIIVIMITHYQRILEHISPEYVHVLVNGTVCTSGDSSLVQTLESKGYDGYLKSN